MLQTNKINDLFQIFNEMTASKRLKNIFESPPFIRNAENILIVLSVASCVILFFITAYAELDPPRIWPSNSFIIFYIATIGFSLLYLTLSTCTIVYLLWRCRKEPFKGILDNLQHDMLKDAETLHRLLAFDRAMLEYGLVQYRHYWGTFNTRLMAVFGNPRQLCLLPVVLTALVTFLSSTHENGDFLAWFAFGFAVLLPLLTLILTIRGERPQQVINLLEYAIRLKTAAESQNEPSSKAEEP